MCADWQRSQAFACRREDGIADRRCDRRYAGLTDTTRWGVAWDDVDVELGRFIQAQDPVVVEVALLHASVAELDVAPKRGRQAIDDAALNLRLDYAGIDRLTAVNDTGDLVELEPAAGL